MGQGQKNDTVGKGKQGRSDNDGTWKDLIENLWPIFIQRTLPELYDDIDLTRPPEFLTQELRDPLPDAMQHNSSLFVDELLKVYLKNGRVQWIYLHIEIQGPGGENITYRMLSYCCLIIAHYHAMPVALAVLTSPRPLAEQQEGLTGTYEAQKYGTQLRYHYQCIELYNLKDEDLLSSDNPIDLAFYAAKKAATCQDKELQKLAYLRELTRVLAEKGWNDKERREIFSFIARIINLKDQTLKEQYLADLKAIKEEYKMESFVEKYFRDEGRQEGIAIGEVRALDAATSFMERNGMSSELISKFRDSFLESVRP